MEAVIRCRARGLIATSVILAVRCLTLKRNRKTDIPQGLSQTWSRRVSSETFRIVSGNVVLRVITTAGLKDWKSPVVDLRISKSPFGRLLTVTLTSRLSRL